MSGVWEQLQLLPVLLSWHVVLTLLAVGIGLTISLPLGVVAARVPSVRGPALLVASMIQTIPSIALLALVFALLVLLRGWLPEAYTFQALGFWPTLIALTLYSILPILRNTVTGLLGVDQAAVEAGRALGMTAWQRLRRVELPLALPVLVAGLRTAVVWTVGVATLSTPIGQKSLGNYIFGGLQTFNLNAILVGCVAAAALAITLDLIVGRMERGASQRRGKLVAMLGVILLGLGVASVGVLWIAGEVGRSQRDLVRIGAKNFNEQFILAALIEDRLQAQGMRTQRLESLGSLNVFNALAAGDIDVYVDYTGTLWSNAMGREPGPPPDVVVSQATAWLEETHGIRLLGSLGFENAYALAMREDDARRRGVSTIDDLTPQSEGLRIGSDIEFFERPEWDAVREGYQLAGMRQVPMNPSLMYQAVVSGDVDVITAFTSDGRIVKFDLRLLEDTKKALPPYDAVVLLSSRVADDEKVLRALRPLIGAIDLEAMQRANLRVDEDGVSPAEAARSLSEAL